MEYASNPDMFKSLVDKFERDAGNKVDILIKELREFELEGQYDIKVNPKFSLGMIGLALDFAPIPENMKWAFFVATDDYKFVTSDNPLFYFDPTCDPSSLCGGGFLSKNVEVTFSISKDLAFLGTWKNGEDEDYVKVNNNRVRAINHRTVVSASRFIFSSQKSGGLNGLVQKYKYSAPRVGV
jgi:uncharacterized protein DUF4238